MVRIVFVSWLSVGGVHSVTIQYLCHWRNTLRASRSAHTSSYAPSSLWKRGNPLGSRCYPYYLCTWSCQSLVVKMSAMFFNCSSSGWWQSGVSFHSCGAKRGSNESIALVTEAVHRPRGGLCLPGTRQNYRRGIFFHGYVGHARCPVPGAFITRYAGVQAQPWRLDTPTIHHRSYMLVLKTTIIFL
jgi:hypothetical protein